ncbi:MAG TPA: hypothetical protein VKB26_12805 [Candidatus Acidoferrales bacterium]|nr:hypothetical protein [Candidatus Acidoferrales bacterium]
MAKKKANRKKGTKRAVAKKPRGKKAARRSAATPTKKQRSAKNERARRGRLSRGLNSGRAMVIPESEPERSLAAGQSGDVEGLSDVEDVDSESVEELAEEGQDYEAEIVGGVERAGDRPGEEVRTDVEDEEEERPRPERQTL